MGNPFMPLTSKPSLVLFLSSPGPVIPSTPALGIAPHSFSDLYTVSDAISYLYSTLGMDPSY